MYSNMQSQRENLSLQQKMLIDKCRTDISRRQTHSISEKYPSTSTCVSLCEFIYQKTSWIFSPSLACKWAQMSLIKPLLINSLREAVLSVDLKNLKKGKNSVPHRALFSYKFCLSIKLDCIYTSKMSNMLPI